MPCMPQLVDIFKARERTQGLIRHTPLTKSTSLSGQVQHDVLLKLETLQQTGSFKLRGALNAVLNLTQDERHRGVIGVSTGNYGRALAYAARQAGIRAVICMSELVPQNKIDAIRELGAEIHIVGRSQDEADQAVDRLVAAEGLIKLPPFDHPDVIAGQGTCGLEILQDRPDVETVLVPLSGGGLIAGVALAIKSIQTHAKVIGITMENGCAMHQSLLAGHPVNVEETASLADSLGGGIGLDNQYTFAMTQALVDDSILVSEKEIAAAIKHAYFEERMIVEGAGAVGIAALLAGKIKPENTTALVISGQNIDTRAHLKLLG